MKINSNTTKNNFIEKIIGIINNIYGKITILIIIISILLNIFSLGWLINAIIFLCVLVGITIFITIYYYEILNFKLYFMICGLFFILSANTHIIPGLNEFKTSEKINEVIPIAPNKLYYNDKNKIFILFLENENQPLTLIMNNSAIYHRLKADFLDKKIQVQRKKVKYWYEEKITTGYYLDDHKFD